MPVVEHAGGIQRITGEKHTTDMPVVEHTGSQGSQQGMRTVSEMRDSYGYRKKGLPHLRERQTFLFWEKHFSLRISLMMKITGTDALLKTNLLQIPLLRMCKER